MPQPLSSIRPKLGFILSGGEMPLDYEMAMAVVGVINRWSHIESTYAGILARIARADPVTVMAVFQSMVSGEARQSALFAAAKARLAPEQSSLIMAVVDTFKASRSTRNAFAHHLWGSLNMRPGCVILAPPSVVAKYTAEILAREGPPPDLDRSQIMVWKDADFRDALNAASVACDRVSRLQLSFDHPSADRMRQVLLEDPQIQRRYDLRLAENTP